MDEGVKAMSCDASLPGPADAEGRVSSIGEQELRRWCVGMAVELCRQNPVLRPLDEAAKILEWVKSPPKGL